MVQYKLSADEVTHLANLLGAPAGDYSEGSLTVHKGRESEVAAILADPAWRDRAASGTGPDEIEFRQLVIGAFLEGWITQQEAEAWARREALPAIVDETIGLLPPEQRPIARITALTMTQVRRDDPLIAAAAQVRMPNATAQQRAAEGDRLFRQWANI